MQRPSFTVSLAGEADRPSIYQARHATYAEELGQHLANPAHEIRDALDGVSAYLVVRDAGKLAGFVALTPPGETRFSIDEYFPRSAVPFPFDDTVGEVRLLTVLSPYRRSLVAALLMYAALRWLEAQGATRLVGLGQDAALSLYRKAGLITFGPSVHSGAITYHLLGAESSDLRRRAEAHVALLLRVRRATDWQLPFAFQQPAACFHGGKSFRAVGDGFDTLERRADIINADVLDAWFPPAPGVLSALREHLPWLVRTSPPADGAGLVAALAAARGLRRANFLLGAGSSDLIFRVLPRWLQPGSRVLLLDPTYGEYGHILERVLRCAVERFPLSRADGYKVDPIRLASFLERAFDLVVLVNPNSPTGQHLPRVALKPILHAAPTSTRFWIDETYVDYLGPGESLETFAAQSHNVAVCKSMSKAYALSGVRAAYLCANPVTLEPLRAYTPPWVVSLPAQVAAVRALADSGYYSARYQETHALRAHLAEKLAHLDWDVVPNACANFLFCHLPESGPDATTLIRACETHGLFLRNASPMGANLDGHIVRIAVKDATTNARMLAILRQLTNGSPSRS